jgi:hypothetical protein
VFLEPVVGEGPIKVFLECECGMTAHSDVQATIDRRALGVEIKYAKLPPPEFVVTKGHVKRR